MAIRYPDRWLRGIGIPFLAVFTRHPGDPRSLYELLQLLDDYFDLLAGLLIAAVVWETNRQLIFSFDRRYSWVQQPFQRLAVQELITLGGSTLLLVGLIFSYNKLIRQRGPEYHIGNLFVLDVLMSLVFVVAIHTLYAISNLIQTYESELRTLRQQLAAADKPIWRNIANMEAIKQVQQKEQGGFVLRLQPQYGEEVTVSKKKAVEFKAWIDR